MPLSMLNEMIDEKLMLLDALETAKQFIANGIELGYICMPDDGDPANEALRVIDEAIRKARVDGNG